MISGIKGTIVRFGASTVHIDTGGVIYEVHIPLNVFDELQKIGPGEAFLHIHHHYMQDEQRLYGFSDPGQRELFIAVKSIKGLGTALALSVLSHLDGHALLSLCERKDIKTLCKIPRVGKATAETMVFEINRRRDRWAKIVADSYPKAPQTTTATPQEDLAFQALLQLGYKEKEIYIALDELRKTHGPDLNASELIRESLRII